LLVFPQKQISGRVFQDLNQRKKSWILMTYILYLCFQKIKVTKYIWEPQHLCTSSKLGPGFPTPYVVVCLRSVVWGQKWLFDMLILVALLTKPSLFSKLFNKLKTTTKNQLKSKPQNSNWTFFSWIVALYKNFRTFVAAAFYLSHEN